MSFSNLSTFLFIFDCHDLDRTWQKEIIHSMMYMYVGYNSLYQIVKWHNKKKITLKAWYMYITSL